MRSSLKMISVTALAALGLATAAFARQQNHQFDASMLDGDHNGAISDAELGSHLDQLFAHSDANHDGKLDQAEIAALHAMVHGAMTSPSTMVHGSEQPMMTTMSQAQFRQVMTGFASRHDADGNHILSVAELNAAFRHGSGR
jgi:hypothetical protein